ncbi:hypothetical protein ES703_106349 [subsurface metagenome]
MSKPSNVKLGKRYRATKADLVCSVPECTNEPEYHMGGGGWSYVYRDGDWKTRFLCAQHREKWFEFCREHHRLWNYGPKPGEDGWLQYWERIFGCFLKWVKGELEICPFCDRPMDMHTELLRR